MRLGSLDRLMAKTLEWQTYRFDSDIRIPCSVIPITTYHTSIIYIFNKLFIHCCYSAIRCCLVLPALWGERRELEAGWWCATNSFPLGTAVWTKGPAQRWSLTCLLSLSANCGQSCIHVRHYTCSVILTCSAYTTLQRRILHTCSALYTCSGMCISNYQW